MNKYVRTKDGIYEFEKIKSLNVGAIGEVVKRADTIEELCDHLVVIEKGNSLLPNIQYRFLGDLFLHRSYNEKFKQNKLIVYGAIWTDKGLLYVAKMNKERELALL